MPSSSLRLKTTLFTNYLIHGFGMIILTQNLVKLSHHWNSSLTVASFVLSGIGIGRLVAYLLMGFISDQFGRKTTLLIGMTTYLIFLVATPFNSSVALAYALAILAGVANSALDSATYPLLAEINKNGTSNSVLLKAFISLGEFILPMIVLFLSQNNLWFGLSFMVPATLMALNLANLLPLNVRQSQQVIEEADLQGLVISRPKKVALSGGLFVYGYTSMAVMIWFTQWITIFAKKIGFSTTVAHFLLSLYSLGSITGVITVVVLLNRFNLKKPVFVTLNALSLLAITTITLSTNADLSAVAAFVFGFSAAGGLMQIALNTLLSIFPRHKGMLTGTFFIFGSLASFSVPIITGLLVKMPHTNIMAGDIIVAFVGFLVALIMLVTLPPENSSLADARKSINKIDSKLIALLEERFAAVNDVHKFKQTGQIAIKDLNRERQVLDNVAKKTKNKDLVPYNQAIVQTIMDNSRQYQASLK
ncbi:MFS transporter [Fructobacillus ficulneus]|uniref:Transport protein n=1 Tax=Fructobacillus ficulneus TaxID=157463 RepID=A0A0K8MH87_9LACO|nr:MFS transporter [Fructobacillus ficulneus]GAO99528.1 transport protein [Fructobacillus ficulneus]